MDKNQKFIIDKFVITQCRQGTINNLMTSQNQGMFHDFGVCKDYSVFVDSSISFNTQKLPPLYVDDQKMIHIVIIPRYIKSLTETILIKLDFSGAAFHVANTFQTETSIIVQVHISKNLDTFTDPFEDFPIFEGYTDSAPYLYIFEISLETRTATHRIVSCDPTEFPVINSDYEGKKNEWVWAGYLEPGYTHKMNGQVKINIQTGLIEKKYKYDENTFGGEFSFVKRIDGSKEDDGYLCGYVFEERVDLGVMHGIHIY